MDHILIFGTEEGGEEVNVTDRFLGWYERQADGPQKTGGDRWRFAAGGELRRTSDADGVALASHAVDRDRLYRILADFFAFTADGVGHAALSATTGSGGVVLVSNDPRLVPDATGAKSRGLMKSFRASDVLVGTQGFGAVYEAMFGRRSATDEMDEHDGEAVTSEVRRRGGGPWIFADLRRPADAGQIGRTAFLIDAGGLAAGEVMASVLGVPEVRVYADDYFTYADETSMAQVSGQPFPTDAGVFVEIRLDLPPGLSEAQICARMADGITAASLAGAWLERTYDDVRGTVDVSALGAGGSLGARRVLKMAF